MHAPGPDLDTEPLLPGEMMVDEVAASAVAADGVCQAVTLWLDESTPSKIDYRLRGQERRSVAGVDFYDCMIKMRHELESSGLLLCCAGVLPNVFPSGMLRQMGDGRRAYNHEPGRPVDPS